jgi:hypothetical protein
VLHPKSWALLLHALAQIDEYLVGICHLDQSKAWILEIDDHIGGNRQGDGKGDQGASNSQIYHNPFQTHNRR